MIYDILRLRTQLCTIVRRGGPKPNRFSKNETIFYIENDELSRLRERDPIPSSFPVATATRKSRLFKRTHSLKSKQKTFYFGQQNKSNILNKWKNI